MNYTWNDSGIVIPSKSESEKNYRNERRKQFISDVDQANKEFFNGITFEYPKWLVNEIINAGYDVEIVEVNSGSEYRNAGEFEYVKGYISWI